MTCLRCGALLGSGEVRYCGSACEELARRGVPHDEEVRRRSVTEVVTIGPVRMLIGTEVIR